MRLLSFASALTVVAGLGLGAEANAFAYCRMTTCTCKTDKVLLDATGEQLFNDNGVPQTSCGQPDGECPRDEHGCMTRGAPTAWTGSCIGFSPNLAGTTQLSPDEYDAAFDAAFHAWALVDCGGGKHPSIQAFMLRPTSCAASTYDPTGPNVNSLYFTDDGWSDYTSPSQLDSIIARTKTHFSPAGVIVDADIAINSARHDFTVGTDAGTVAYDLVSILTHEAGHFIGLDHSEDPNAVMYYAYTPGAVRRMLQADDIAAVCTVYPPERVAGCDPTPTGGLADTCDPRSKAGCTSAPAGRERASGTAPMVMSILGMMVLWAKRRKR